MADYQFNDHFIPLEAGQSVSRGWTSVTDHRPVGVTWHWTAGRSLAGCRATLGGPNAERKGQASAHYGVGRKFSEGVDRYVSLDNRSWHAGRGQVLRWDGKPSDSSTTGARTTIGIETVGVGFARGDVQSEPDWISAASPNSRHVMLVQPWTEEQIEMMVAVGREIVDRWPHIGVREHHGHHDLCPGYKEDVAGFPFARVLSGIYQQEVPDVWTSSWLPAQRQKALVLLGYDLGNGGLSGDGVDGLWGRRSDEALCRFQEDHGLVVNGLWTTFVCWAIHDALAERGTGYDGLGGWLS